MSTVIFILICLGVAYSGSASTLPAIDGWYAGLHKPFYTPPNWLFGPVWTLLYILMAVAADRVWRRRLQTPRAMPALGIFALQLGLNALWSPLFFGQKALLAALVCIALLWMAIAWTLFLFHTIDRTAGRLLWPYLAWVSYATALNASIYAMNR